MDWSQKTNKMNRFLLLAIAAGLLSPIAALSGDLGNADMPSIEEAYIGRKNYEILLKESQSNVFNLRCSGELVLGGSAKCKVEFKNGRLVVDDSIGIKPSQVINIIGHHRGATYYIKIAYFDSRNKYSVANFYNAKRSNTIDINRLYPFKIRLHEWMNTGK